VNLNRRTLFALLVLLAAIVSACAGSGGAVTTGEEESGAELALDESYDAVRNGARLVLTYDPQSNSFNGYVENTRDESLKQVRVEVHLSNGVELGPTTPTDLVPGERLEVSLAATDEDFDRWTAHPEVGAGEHGHDGDEGEHGEEGQSGHQDGDSD
jgi:hypothetical protein